MKVLIATMPYLGNLKFQPVAAELIRRGHEVLWLSGEEFREMIEITGAAFVSSKLLIAEYHLLRRSESRGKVVPRCSA
jgi:UDP:flavonoid glycosyltransferase YjiC (YdhE family)